MSTFDALALTHRVVQRPKDGFAWRVCNDCFKAANIHAGDTVIFDRAAPVRPDALVAVYIKYQNVTIVRRWHPLDGGRVELRAEAPGVEPIILNAADVTVQGRVIGIIRNHEEAKAGVTVERKAQPRKAAPASETLWRRA